MTRNEDKKTPTEADDSRASHRALHVIVNELRAWAQATADYQLGIVDEETTEKANDAMRQAYVNEYTKRGGDACHQGWEIDMDPAGDWWVGNPDASDEEWFAELAEWCWIDEEGNDHDRPAPDDKEETLTERMAMAFFYVGTGDEDNHRNVLRWVRQDDHASIAWLILSDHTLTDDKEAWELVEAIYSGGEAG